MYIESEKTDNEIQILFKTLMGSDCNGCDKRRTHQGIVVQVYVVIYVQQNIKKLKPNGR